MRVDVFCPGGSVSGGPEALHQLCGALRARGVDAAMVYYGGVAAPVVPPAYDYCGAAVRSEAGETAEMVVIVPEVATSLIWRFPAARKAIWWLSVDNYFKWRHLNPGPSVLTRRNDVLHLCQSAYAHDFLAKSSVAPAFMLTDYLTPKAFQSGPPAGRLAAIAYNPKKALPPQQHLIAASPRHAWIGLERMDKPALADLLRAVRLYIDFGPHPGCDRLPREAALSGAVVVTGRRGAAGFEADLPLPEQFRLDDGAPGFEARALGLIDRLLADEATFLQAWGEQCAYRAWIEAAPIRFAAEVDALVELLPQARKALPAAQGGRAA